MTQSNQDIKSAVDIVIFTIREKALQVVLIQMKKKPFTTMWAFPGGLISKNESLDDAALRELAEKTGIKSTYLEQLYTFGEPKRDPNGRVISTVYFALVNSILVSGELNLKTTTKYSDVRWFNISSLPKLAYDHKKIAKYAHQRLQWKLEYTNIVYSLLPKYFTLSELRKIYETILAKPLDRRNFQRKILSLGLLKKTSKIQGGKHRPAQLYEFTTRKPRIVEVI